MAVKFNQHNLIFKLLSFIAINHVLVAFAHFEPGSGDPLSGMSTTQIRDVLTSIFKKIDQDGSKTLSEQELAHWAKRVIEYSTKKSTTERWQEIGLKDGDTLSWNKYKELTFGLDSNFNDEISQNNDVLIKQLTERDRAKWELADVDRDGVLSHSEFAAFLHPESYDHMHDTILLATVDDMDSNKDGHVSETEFIGDIHNGEEGAGTDAEEQPWVVEQRRQFREVHDVNGDGVLDMSEIRAWLNPLGYSAAGTEAKHVLYSCDTDRDGSLSLSELIDKPDAFARTMLADYGNALRYHDEL